MPHRAIYNYRNTSPPQHRRGVRWLGAGVLLVAVLGTAAYAWHGLSSSRSSPPTSVVKAVGAAHREAAVAPAASTTPSSPPNPCAGNDLAKQALISISQRHLWACQGASAIYSSAVVTGMENLPADLTPTGTYHVYGKQTNLYLNGSDSTGSWHDYVYYWMPFLDNQYGAYGFHDATWRPAGAFGNISPFSTNASHGCVELPLATAKWLYNWVAIGTTVTIES